MDIKWDKQKNLLLKAQRGITLKTFADMIAEGDYIARLENPTRPEQEIFLCRHKGYIYVVPFIMSAKDDIVLKTAYPSRKYHRLYGGVQSERS